MAFENFDTSGNEDTGRIWHKIRAMLSELYASVGTGAASITSLVTSTFATVGTLLTTTTFKLDTGTKTATATAGAATLAKAAGKITSEALTTAAGAAYTLTITNTAIAAADQAFASVANGTNTQGWLHVERVTPGANSLVVVVRNIHASEALNGTIVVSFASLKN